MIKWIYKKIKLSFKLFILGILALAAFSFGVYAQNNHSFYENYGKNITTNLKDFASSCETSWEEFKVQHEENQKIKEQKEKDAQAEEEAKAKVATAEKEVADKIAAEKKKEERTLASICDTMYANVVVIDRRAVENDNKRINFKYAFLNELDSKYVKEFSFNETKWKYSIVAGHEKFLMIIYSEELIFYSIWVEYANEFIHLGGIYTTSTDTLTMKRNFLDEDFTKYTKLYHQLLHAFYGSSTVMPTTE